MLKVHNSNRLESLFHDLSDLQLVPLANPLAPEIVLVQSQGMARWLSLQTAAQQKIAANIDCSFPASFIWGLLRLDTKASNLGDPYERDALVWTVFGLLQNKLDELEFSSIKKYLSGGQRSLKLYQLSHKIACLFDQYMVFRPDWILEWSSGAGEGWQPILWRAVQESCGGKNRSLLLKEFLESADGSLVKKAKLPERLSLFGIPALPPSMFSVFAKLAEWIDVHIFLLQPCGEYWADLVSPIELSRIDLRSSQSYDASEDLHFEKGNPLLLNMGKMGRDFQHVLHSFDFEEVQNFSAPAKETLLTAVQVDILEAAEPGGQENVVFSHDDRSIQIHAVHSPMREVEVLYQNLLSMFQKNKELNPADVLVMVPDINLYAPFIEAVFSTPEQEDQAIPFTIADKGAGGGHYVKAFLSLLALLSSRVSASLVFDFLSLENVRKQFEIQEDEMETIRTWIEESAINWGIDGRHREDLGLPHEKYGTWQAGLDRLLLGYALPENDSLYFDILPCDQVEGGTAQLLAKFLNFFTKLTAGHRSVLQKKDPAAWARFFRQLLDDFFEDTGAVGTSQREKRAILSAIDSFVRQTETAQWDEKISFEIVQKVLQNRFDVSSSYSEFLGGCVTFCQMVPMRTIPFQVICLLGMNDGAFPRQDRPVGFDLMRGDFRAGDRCRRDDDRYLFLETILSARQVLYISYVGIGVQNSEVFPPSIVVSELLAAIGPYLYGKEKDGRRGFITEHPLQPFSEKYFLGNPDLINFSKLYHETAQTIKNDTVYNGLFDKRLEKAKIIDLSISDFLTFFEHPVRYLLRKQLGLNLDDRHSDLEDREILSLNSLERYKLLSGILTYRLAGEEKDPGQFSLQLQEKGAIPFGNMGQYECTEATKEIDSFLEPFWPQFAGPPLEPISLCLDFGGVRVSGVLQNIWPAGQVLIRPTSVQRLTYRDTIRFWILHLLLNASETSPVRTTYFIGKDGQETYGPIEDALEELTLLACLVVEGLQAPLPLLPKSTFSYAQKMWTGKPDQESSENMKNALFEAEKQWLEGDIFNGPEKDDPYLWASFGENNPFSWNSPGRFSFGSCAATLLQKAFRFRMGNKK